MGKKYNCPYCDYRNESDKLIRHIDSKHQDLIPEGYTPSRIVYNIRNKREHGSCMMCKKPTEWNESNCRYNPFCSKECHDKYVKRFEDNMQRTYHKKRLTDDPTQQEKMLANRRISGKYKFQDGGVKTYTGSFERKALEFLDKVMNVKSDELMMPGPVIEYKDDQGVIRHYISDIYWIDLNLLIEVKDGGDNPNNRSMPEYRAKQLAKEKTIVNMDKYNYLRLTNNNFAQLLEIIAEIKKANMDEEDRRVVRINESMVLTESESLKLRRSIYESAIESLKDEDDFHRENIFEYTNMQSDNNDVFDIEKNRIKFINGDIDVAYIGLYNGDDKLILTNFNNGYKLEIAKADAILDKMKMRKIGLTKRDLDKFNLPIEENKYECKVHGVIDTVWLVYDKAYNECMHVGLGIDNSYMVHRGLIDTNNKDYEEILATELLPHKIVKLNSDGVPVSVDSSIMTNCKLTYYKFKGPKERFMQVASSTEPITSFYEALTGKTCYSPDQIEYDDMFEKVNINKMMSMIDETALSLLQEAAIECSDTFLPYMHVMNKDDFKKKQEILSGYNDMEILEDVDGYFLINTNTLRRGKSVKDISLLKVENTTLHKPLADLDSDIVDDWEEDNGVPILGDDFKTMSQLNTDYDEIQALSDDEREISDIMSISLYGKTNETRYYEMLSKFLKDDLPEPPIEYNGVREATNGILSSADILNEASNYKLNILFSKEDIVYNAEPFIDKKINVLFVTGLSGAGKTTIAAKWAKLTGATLISLDDFDKWGEWDYYNKENNTEWYPHALEAYFSKKFKSREEYEEYIGIKSKDYKKYYKALTEMCNWFVNHSSKNNRFIIEGVQVPIVFLLDSTLYKRSAILLKNTSLLTSFIRRIKRDKASFIKRLPHYINLYFDWYISQNNFRTQMQDVESLSYYGNSIVSRLPTSGFTKGSLNSSIKEDANMYKKIFKNNMVSTSFVDVDYDLNDMPFFTPYEIDAYGAYSGEIPKEILEVLKEWFKEYKAVFSKKALSEKFILLNKYRIDLLKDMDNLNEDTILACGWIPNIKFSNINRHKANKRINKLMREAKEFPIQFNKNGDLILRLKSVDYEEEYQKAHKLLKEYDSRNNIDGMKYELARLWYINNNLEAKIYALKKDNRSKEVRLRSRVLSDFNKYLSRVLKEDRSFNFTEYFERSPYSDKAVKIHSSTLDYTVQYIKKLLAF